MAERRRYDSELADRTIRKLAAVTDAELAADIRQAAAELLAVCEARSWRLARDHPMYAFVRDLGAVVVKLRRAVDALPAGAELDQVVEVGRIPLGEFWPPTPDWTDVTPAWSTCGR